MTCIMFARATLRAQSCMKLDLPLGKHVSARLRFDSQGHPLLMCVRMSFVDRLSLLRTWKCWPRFRPKNALPPIAQMGYSAGATKGYFAYYTCTAKLLRSRQSCALRGGLALNSCDFRAGTAKVYFVILHIC